MFKKNRFASLALLLAATTAMSGMPAFAMEDISAESAVSVEDTMTEEIVEAETEVSEETSEDSSEKQEEPNAQEVQQESESEQQESDKNTAAENDAEQADESATEIVTETANVVDETSDEALLDEATEEEETVTAEGEAVVQSDGGIFDSYVEKVKVTYNKESGTIVKVEDNGTDPGDDDTSWDRNMYAQEGRSYRGKTYVGVFDGLVGKTKDEIDGVDAVTTATISSEAIKAAVKDAMGEKVDNETNMTQLTVTVDGKAYNYYYQDSSNAKALVDGVDVTDKRVTVKAKGKYSSYDTVGYYYVADDQKLSGNLYGTASIPYADFYFAEFYGNSGPIFSDSKTQVDMKSKPYQITAIYDSGYDGISSATSKRYGIFSNAVYEGASGDYKITGIKTPVAIDADIYVKALVLEALGKAEDGNVMKSAVDDLTAGGLTTTAPAMYKTLYPDSTLSALTASEGTGSVGSASDVTVTVKDITRRGSFQFEVEGLPDEITNDNILGIVLKTGSGYYQSSYGLEHLENMWKPGDFAITTKSGVTDTAGQKIGYQRHKQLAQNTVTSITYLLKNNQNYTIDGLSLYLGRNVEANQQPTVTSSDETINNQGANAVVDLSKLPFTTQTVEVYKSGENNEKKTDYYNAVRSIEKENATLLTEGTDYIYDAETGAIHINATEATGAGIYIVLVSDSDGKYARSLAAVKFAEGEDVPVEEPVDDGSYVYGTVNLPYADFYYGELNDVAEVKEIDLAANDPVAAAGYRAENAYDATSSATSSRKTTGFGATYYNENDKGGYDIEGLANVNVAVRKSIYDSAVKAIENGETCNNKLLELVGNMTVSESEEAPAEYKELYGNGTLGKMVTAVDEQSGATATITTNSVWADYQIDVTADGLPTSATVLGAVLEDSEGNKYGLTHADQIWLQSYELAFCVNDDFVEPHGVTRKAKTTHKSLEGATITKITYLVKDGADIVVNTSLKVKSQTKATVTAENGAYPDKTSGSTEIKVTAENLPEGSSYKLASVAFGSAELTEGSDYSYDNESGVLTVNATEKVGVGSYTLTFTDDEYKDLKASFTLSVEGTASIEKNKLVLSNGIDLQSYLNNITDVKVNGVSKAARRVVLKDVLFKEDGSIDLEAVISGKEVFAEDGTYSIEVISTGYPTAKGEVQKPLTEEPDTPEDPKDPEVKKGWQQDEDGIWKYYDENGSVKTGWQQIGGHWYYLDPATGDMKTGWMQIGGHWYYFAPSGGNMAVGWRKIGGHYYYFDAKNGNMATGWRKVDGKYYYLDAKNGDMKTGWLKLGGAWYYLNPSSGAMVTGAKRIGTKTYRFSGSGVCLNP